MKSLRKRRLLAILLTLGLAMAWADTSALGQGRGKGRGAGAGKKSQCSWDRCFNHCMERGGTHRIIISRGCQERCAKRGCTPDSLPLHRGVNHDLHQRFALQRHG